MVMLSVKVHMDIRVVPPTHDYAKVRRWPRFSVELPVTVYCDQPPSISEGQGTSLNIGGMAVRTALDLAVGEQISIEFVPPEASQPVTTRCTVRNRSSQTYGVEFIAESSVDYRAIGEVEYGLSKLLTVLR